MQSVLAVVCKRDCDGCIHTALRLCVRRFGAQTERYFRGFVGLYVARGLCYDKKAA